MNVNDLVGIMCWLVGDSQMQGRFLHKAIIFLFVGFVVEALFTKNDAMALNEYSLEYHVALHGNYVDRGEQLTREAHEMELGLAFLAQQGVVAFGLRRLTPFGDDGSQFDDEFNYSIGYSNEFDFLSYELGLVYLTFPGETSESSLEIGGALGFDMPAAPSVSVFYDTRFSDFGAELAFEPEVQLGLFQAFAVTRMGFVNPGDGGDFTYVGVETGLRHALNTAVDVAVSARWDHTDEDLYIGRIRQNKSMIMKDNGFSIGLYISIAQ